MTAYPMPSTPSLSCTSDDFPSSPVVQQCEMYSSRKHNDHSPSGRDDFPCPCDIEKSKGNTRPMGGGEKEETSGRNSNSYKKRTPLLRPSEKRLQLASKEKPSRKRRVKRHRFSSPCWSDEETKETGDIGHYTPVKYDRIMCPQPTSFHSTGLVGDANNDGKITISGRSEQAPASRMAVVYEQQVREGDIH